MKTVFTLFCLLGTVLGAHSQSLTSSTPTHKNNPWSVSMYGGISRFYGDLREYRFWTVKENNFDSQSENGTWQSGVALKYAFSPIFGLRADIGAGTLRGLKRQVYFSYFRADYRQADVSATINLTHLLLGKNYKSRLEVEFYTGVGVTWFRSTAYELGTGRVVRRSDSNAHFLTGIIGTDGNNQSANQFSQAVAFPTGLTVNYRLTQKLKITFDTRLNFLTTDRLDATIPPVNSAKDKYAWGAVGLTYRFLK